MNNLDLNLLNLSLKAISPLRYIGPFDNKISKIAFSEDGSLLAAGLFDGTNIILNYSSGKIIKEFPSASLKTCAFAFSSDNRSLYTANAEGVLSVIDLKDYHKKDIYTHKHLIHGNDYCKINFLALDEPHSRLYFGGTDSSLYFHDLKRNYFENYHPSGADDPPLGRYFITNGKLTCDKRFLVISCGYSILFIDIIKHRIVRSLGIMPYYVNDFVILPGNQNIIACWLQNGTLSFFNIEKETHLTSIVSGDADWCKIAVSNDGRFIATGCSGNNVIIWDVITKQKVSVLEHHTAIVKSMCFHPVTGHLFTAGYDNIIYEWNIAIE